MIILTLGLFLLVINAVVLIATGSEVEIALDVAERLEKEDEVNRADQKVEQAARFKNRGGAQQKPARAAIDEDAD